MSIGETRSYRPVIMGRRGAVASNHPLATQAGLLTLQVGGNAVDAAVAVAATIGVVEPFMSGLGGDGFYHVFMRAGGEPVVFNATGSAPATRTANSRPSSAMHWRPILGAREPTFATASHRRWARRSSSPR